MLTLDEKLNYTRLKGFSGQEFLDMLSEEELLGIYKSKRYKELDADMNYVLLLLILTNIKLYRTGEQENNKLTNVFGRNAYDYKVTRHNNVELDKEALHEFLDFIMRQYVQVYSPITGNVDTEMFHMTGFRMSYYEYLVKNGNINSLPLRETSAEKDTPITFLFMLIRTYYGSLGEDTVAGIAELDVLYRAFTSELDKVVGQNKISLEEKDKLFERVNDRLDNYRWKVIDIQRSDETRYERSNHLRFSEKERSIFMGDHYVEEETYTLEVFHLGSSKTWHIAHQKHKGSGSMCNNASRMEYSYETTDYMKLVNREDVITKEFEGEYMCMQCVSQAYKSGLITIAPVIKDEEN